MTVARNHPITRGTHNESLGLSQFSIGWNSMLKGVPLDDVEGAFQQEGWRKAREYAAKVKCPIPCPDDWSC